MNDLARRETEPTRTGSQSVERALDALSLFADGRGRAVSEIASALDLSLSTAHRMVRALVRAGYLDQDPMTDRYRLGRMCAVLGRAATESLRLDAALAILRDLVITSGEAGSIGVLDGSDVLIVLSAESSQPLRFDRASGSRTAAHASAIGRTLLAHRGTALEDVVAALGPLERFTPQTITDAETLAAELASVRLRRVAVNREERYVGVCAIAAPVLDERGIARAGVGVQVPSARFGRAQRSRLSNLVRDVSERLADVLPLDRL